MDVFQTGSTLEQLSDRPIKPSASVLGRLKDLANKEPQIISCRWVDKNGVTLGVYFSWSKDKKSDDEAGKGGGSQVNQDNIQESSKVWWFSTFL